MEVSLSWPGPVPDDSLPEFLLLTRDLLIPRAELGEANMEMEIVTVSSRVQRAVCRELLHRSASQYSSQRCGKLGCLSPPTLASPGSDRGFFFLSVGVLIIIRAKFMCVKRCGELRPGYCRERVAVVMSELVRADLILGYILLPSY